MKTRVLEILQKHEGEWVTAQFFLQQYMYTFRNRVGELRKIGHNIESRKQKNSPCYEYRFTL